MEATTDQYGTDTTRSWLTVYHHESLPVFIEMLCTGIKTTNVATNSKTKQQKFLRIVIVQICHLYKTVRIVIPIGTTKVLSFYLAEEYK